MKSDSALGTTPGGTNERSVWLPLVVIGLAAASSLVAFVFLRSEIFSLPTTRKVPPRDLAAEVRADLERQRVRPLSGPLAALLEDPAYKPIPTQTHPLLGEPAPDFTLADADGSHWKLSEKLQDGPVVLVFYYGYTCVHCVSQLFALQKDIDKFKELGAQVVAISPDSSELTRERYKQHGAFPFAVLSDPGNAVALKYGTFSPGGKPDDEGTLMHGTFVIDRKGRVVWVNRADSPFTENRTLLIEVMRTQRAPRRP